MAPSAAPTGPMPAGDGDRASSAAPAPETSDRRRRTARAFAFLVGGDLTRAGPIRSSVPLAWRNVTADKPRLARSAAGIGFAVLLILIQLGFKSAFLDSALEITRRLDGELFLVNPNKFRWGRSDPLPRVRLKQALAVAGVASARPLYAEYNLSMWKGPQDRRLHAVQVLGIDPDEPVLRFPEVEAQLDALRRLDTVLVDLRGRRFLGHPEAGQSTELAGRRVAIAGTFAMGPDFTIDGTVITSDQTFLNLFPRKVGPDSGRGAVELGVIRLTRGADPAVVQAALAQALPPDVLVLTKAEMLAREAAFQSVVSPVGPIFGLGVGIGFTVGILIAYQVLFTELADQMSLFAMLKAIGYDNAYVLGVVLRQALFYAVVSFVPAFLLSLGFYAVIGQVALLPMRMSLWIGGGSLVLTVAMCLASGVVAARRVIAADPADVF